MDSGPDFFKVTCHTIIIEQKIILANFDQWKPKTNFPPKDFAKYLASPVAILDM